MSKEYDEKLNEIFSYCQQLKDVIKLIEDLLDSTRKEMEDETTLAHHGIKGQKWGVKNGPPYPLSDDVSGRVRMQGKWGRDSADYSKDHSDKFEERGVDSLSDLKLLSESANMQTIRRNINHGDVNDFGRHYNCRNCALAFEMTERGYDVQARPAKNRSNVGDITKFFKGGKLEHYDFGGTIPKGITRDQYDVIVIAQAKKVERSIRTQGNGARGIFVLGMTASDDDLSMRTNSFHAVNYKVEGDKVIMFDTQSSKKFLYNGFQDWSNNMYNVDPREWFSMRTDNLNVDESITTSIYSSDKG